MKPDKYHCPRCGFGTGRVERVCWDCRCRAASQEVREEKKPAPRARQHGLLCGECRQSFGGHHALDLHRVGQFERPGKPATRRCLSPDEMRAKGLELRAGVWHQSKRGVEATA